jgi:hypothetical protein
VRERLVQIKKRSINTCSVSPCIGVVSRASAARWSLQRPLVLLIDDKVSGSSLATLMLRNVFIFSRLALFPKLDIASFSGDRA